MMTADMKQFYWMQTTKWVETDDNGKVIFDADHNPIIRQDAPPEAWESYRHWLKKEAQRAERRKEMQAVLERIERGEFVE